MNDAIQSSLKGLFERHGVGLLDESSRLKSFLQDECPQAKREISLLLQALDEQVPQDLMRVHSGEPLQSLAPRLAKRLSDQKGLAPENSEWAVRTWAHGLGVAAPDATYAPLPPSVQAPNEDRMNRENINALTPFENAAIAAQNQAAVAVPDTPPRSPFSSRALIAVAVAIVVAAAVWYQYFSNVFAISRVDTTEPFVANGKSYDVIVEFKARNNPVQNVEVHFVRGDTTWNTNSWTAKVSTDENNLGRASVGAMSYRSTKPASATFQYVLIAADGKRSQPYEKTFNIAPGSLRQPSITTITVPNAIHVGQTFSFNLAYDAPDADIVQIQRRVLESSIKWPQEQTTLNVSGAVGNRGGSVSYAFPASQAPYKATAEFVLVDAQGNRSEPRRTSFEVLPATATAQSVDRMHNNQQIGYRDANGNVLCASCATVVGVREVAREGEATGAGAIVGGLLGGVLGHQVGHGRGNDAATAAGAVAGAVAGHQVEKNVRSSKRYEITVRYNDGHAEVIRQSTAPRWRNGERVQVVNGVLRYAP